MKKIILLLVLFFSFVCLPAQEIDKNQTITYDLSANNKRYTIAEIKIRGVESYNYEDSVLINISGLSIGDKINVPGDKVTSALKSLLGQGLFSWGKILATKQTTDSIWLEIVLKPNPIISSFNFIGIKKVEQEELKANVGINSGSQLTFGLINCLEKRIKDYFFEKGFSNAEVRIEKKNDIVDERKVTLDITVNKNQKIKIRCIHIIGNNVLSDYDLKTVMQNTNEKFSLKKRPKLSLLKIFNSKNFIRERYNEDIENIILKYNEKGYKDACIINDSIAFINDSQVDIYLTINEGRKYYIRNINWFGNTLYSSEKLDSVLGMKLGDIYNQKKINERLLGNECAVSNLYYNKGYIFSSISPIEVCIENDSIDLEIRVSEGIQASINHIFINGNDRIYEDIIRRELLTKPGQLFSKEVLVRSSNEIAQMGYFDAEKIDIQPIIDPETGMVDINYNLTPKLNDQLEFSAGWGGKGNGVVGCLNLKFSNFSIKSLISPKKYKGIVPHGEGQTLTLNAQTNGNYQSFGISFLEPWFGGKRPNNLSLNANYRTETKKNTLDTLLNVFGFSTGYSKRLSWLGDYFILMSELSYQYYQLENWQDFPIHNGIAHSIALGLELSRNSANNQVYPSYGSISSLSINTTPPYSLFSSWKDKEWKWIEYCKWKFKSKIFVPLVNEKKSKYTPVLMSRVEYGFNYPLGDNLFGNFCMGGEGITGYSTTCANEIVGLRGYKPNTDTSKNIYTRLALELRCPFVLEQTATIYGLAFIEAGNTWAAINPFTSFRLKRSAGMGVRIFFPIIGLVGGDLAYGFDEPFGNPEIKISGFQFHFILGQEF